MRHALVWLLALALLPGCATVQPVVATGQPAREQIAVTLYRGLRVMPGTGNQIDWSRNSFGVSGNPATLSLFDNMAGIAAPCWLSVTANVAPPVVPNVAGTLTVPPVNGAGPSPWAVAFNNVPPGHWEIPKTSIGGGSNNQASTLAAATMQAMQANGTAAIVDGTAQGCH